MMERFDARENWRGFANGLLFAVPLWAGIIGVIAWAAP
jgi:hypothetical protein